MLIAREAFFCWTNTIHCQCMFMQKQVHALIEISFSGLTSNFFNLCAENRNHLKEVSDDTIVRHIKDRCFRVFINGQNHF